MAESASEPNINILVWNVRWGKLPEKVQRLNSEKHQEIGQYDIICLVEAYKPKEHTELLNALTGFSCLYLENMEPIRKKQLSRIGGIAVYVKTRKAKDCVEVLNTEVEGNIKDKGLVKWLKIHGKNLGFEADVYVCVVYLPGPSTIYWGRGGRKSSVKESKFIKMISDDVNARRRNGDMVIVAGDFNCRIGNFQDRISPDQGLLRNGLFEKFVTDSELLILNGRQKDLPSEEPEYTRYSNSPSVVDYALVSEYHRHGVKFQVGAFDKTFELDNSDHRSLRIVVSTANKDPTQRIKTEVVKELFNELSIDSCGSASEVASTSSSTRIKEKVKKEVKKEYVKSCDDCGLDVPLAELSSLEVEVLQQENRRLRLYCQECEGLW